MERGDTGELGVETRLDLLAHISQLYRQGLYLQAHRAAQPLGPLVGWCGAEGRVMAGRLAAVLGGYRTGMLLHRLAHREHRDDPLAAYYAARATLHARGPWAAWQRVERPGWSRDGDAALAADRAAFRGYLLALFRDFQRARPCFEEAMRLAPQRPWIHVERATALALEDRLLDALHAAQTSLELQPWNRPGVQSVAHIYRQMNRHDDALALLEAAAGRLECGETLIQLADLYEVSGNHPAARRAIDRAAELLSLPDAFTQQRLDALRCDAAYHCGDEQAAIEFAERLKAGFHARVAKSLQAATPDERRVVLAVPFVQQHHLTCAPATLASIAQYWRRLAEYLEIAEAICYDGTPAHSERRWAEQAGFVVREFTVDWSTTLALVDRGLPFTFTTVEATTSHLQAVVGYDARRRTLLLRDPSLPRLSEMLADEGLAYYRGFGPRGMVLVPREEVARLDNLSLPDAALYDEFYELQQALSRHDRTAAFAAYLRMAAAAAEHRLTIDARRTIAYYDADYAAVLHGVEQALAAAPDSPPLLFAKLNLLRSEVSRAERLPFLEAVSRRRDLDPVFRLHWAEELAQDGREQATARRVLERLLQRRPGEGRVYFALANIAWSDRKFEQATELYRFAACLDDRRELPSRQYFIASRHVKRTQESLDWLADRQENFGDQSSQPAQTLFWAYEALDRTQDAFRVLEEAARRRPDDDTLPLVTLDAYARYGRFTQAAEVLAACRGRVHESAWLRAAAQLAGYRGELAEALAHWRQVVDREPQSAEAVNAVAQLVEQIEGRPAALAYWQAVLARFPHNVALLRAVVTWVRDFDHLETERMLDRLLANQPIEPWARRERAVLLAGQQRLDEALADAELAIELAPDDSYGYSVRGNVLSRLGRLAQAADSYRRALVHSVDNHSAIQNWLADCRSLTERREALAFFHDQLVAQTTFGEGLLAYAELARHVLDGETLLANLRAGLEARPDLWHAWSAVVHHLVAIERVDDAAKLAEQMVSRFPLLPGAWADLAVVCQVRGDARGEIAALEKALEINCQWGTAIFRLVDAHTRENQLDKAQALVEQALRRLPQVAILHGYRADLLWRLGDRDAALAAIRRAIEIDPDYAWGWQTLEQWAAATGRPDLAAETARSAAALRPGEARSWYWLARIVTAPEAEVERIEAARRATELDGSWVAAQALYSQVLAAAGRFDEAIAVCRPAGDVRVPRELTVQEAAVLKALGRRDEAVDLVRSLLAENPDYLAGWYQLAAWGGADPGLQEVQLEAARQLVRLDPHEPEAWRHLGEATNPTDTKTAKAAWARALQLLPTYRYAAAWLFDLQMADNEFAAAAETLGGIEEKAPDPFVWARRVQLATTLWRPSQTEALEALDKLCMTDTSEPWPLAAALDALAKRGWLRPAMKRLRRSLDDASASRYVLAEWVSLLVQRRAWYRAKQAVARHAPTSVAWNLAADRLLSAWAVSKPGGLKRFVRTHAQRLQADTDLWGTAGYALHSRGYHRDAVKWLALLPRSAARPWILINLAVSLRWLKQDFEASNVHHAALALPRDHTTPMHEIWLALDAALAGHDAEAAQRLQAAEGAELPPFYETLRLIAQHTIDLTAGLSGPPRWFDWWRISRRARRATHTQRLAIRGHRLLQRAQVRALGRQLRAGGYRSIARWLPYVVL